MIGMPIMVIRSQQAQVSFLVSVLLHQLDHSIVKSYMQGDRMAITSRGYPTEAVDEQAHVFHFNNGTTLIKDRSINVWQMQGINVILPA
jgi:hypothetical protein